MNSESVDLIATDPPFNKGRDFHATPDSLAAGARFQDRWSWERDVHTEWVDQLTDDQPKLMAAINAARATQSDGMGAYLCFMSVRLLEMRRGTEEDGQHLPALRPHRQPLPQGGHGRHLRVAEFLQRDCLVLHKRRRERSYFEKKHDLIMSYAKSHKSYTFNTQYRPYSAGTMQRGLTQYKKNLNEAYQLSKKGAVQNDWWTDIQPILSPTAKEQTGYPTQKPLALYSRIIKASPNENDIVLDPFAGCAITLVAAEIVGRKWVGMDIWENAKSVIVERMEREGLIQKGRQAKQGNLFARDIHFTDRPPERTDEGDEAVLFPPRQGAGQGT